MGNIGANPANGNYRASQRTIVTVEGKAGDITAFVGVQDDFQWSKADDDFYIGEAWVQFGTDVTFKAGRQMFAMDEGRLMGYDDWNAGLVYDGLLIGYGSGDYNLNLFATRLDGGDLFVLHPSTKLGGIDISIPIMYGTNAIGGGDMDVSGITAGIYAKSDGDFSWRFEGYFQQNSMQMGDADALTTTGMMVSVAAGYKVNDMIAPRLNVDYTAGAGDEAHVFSTGLGDTHKFNGRSGIVDGAGPGGLIDVSVSNDFGEMGPGSLSLDFHYMMLADA
jgi:hypothetical protein